MEIVFPIMICKNIIQYMMGVAVGQSFQFALGTGTAGIPLNANVYANLQDALQGGQATATFVKNQLVLQNFYNWIAEEEDAAWTASTDESGNPVMFAAQVSPGESLSLVVRPVLNQAVLNGQTPPESMSVNGEEYDVIGSMTVTLTYNETPLWVLQEPLGVLQRLGIRALMGIAWNDFLKPMIAGLARALQNGFARAPQIENPEDIDDAASDVAEQGSITDEAVGVDTLSMVLGAAATVAVVVLAALPALLDIFAHQTFQGLQIYNLTPYDVTWTVDYLAHGAAAVEPSDGTGTAKTLIPGVATIPVPGSSPLTVASQAQFAFASASEVTGIAYVLTFTVNDATSNTSVGGAAVMFDIPFAGENSLAVSASGVSSAESWYDEVAGKNNATQARASGSNFTISATFDYLSGEHPAPSGQNMYWYNSLIVFNAVGSSQPTV